MKKTLSFVFAAIAVLTVASCAREMFEPAEENLSGEKVTFTLSLAENGSKTALEAGKTVWADGDSILLADGSKTLKVGIPSEAVGQKEASISINLEKINVYGDLYAVYPPTAYKSVSSGSVVVAVPSDQSGNFDEANICVAKCTCPDNNFALKNATALVKLTVADDVETVMISAAAIDTLAGNLACTYKKDTALVVKAASPVKSVKLALGGVGGEYYVAVVPGTYTEFSVMALSLAGQSQRKITTNKTLKVNDLADLGTIGDNMSGSSMEGAGTEDDPFLIKDLADMTTLATFVNNGLSYADNYFKVMNDIDDISIPVGTFDQVALPFQGIFDGQNHDLKLAMSESADNYLGLFGYVGEGAAIKNVIVKGAIKTTGSYVGGLAAFVDAGAGASISTCINYASVEGVSSVGGLIGSCQAKSQDLLTVEYCVNDGAVTANTRMGGVIGYAVYTKVEGCTNNAAVVSTNESVYSAVYSGANGTNVGTTGTVMQDAVGGVVGFGQNATVVACTNTGAVTGLFKVGGILGGSNWTGVTSCNNSGDVTATGSYVYNISSQMGYGYGSVCGGIVGYYFVAGNITDCVNSGTIKARGGQGGIVGVNCQSNSGGLGRIINCKNTGDVIGENVYQGGVAGNNPGTGGICGNACGFGVSGSSDENYHRYLTISGCENTGNVTSDKLNTGGILGVAYETRNGVWCTSAKIIGCINNGTVTGKFWVGGILGYAFSRYAAKCDVFNCENHGDVIGTRADADNGVVVGGIVGGCGANSSSYFTKAQFVRVYNCLNDGSVTYTSETYVKPYVGGIIGNAYGRATIQNCCNLGTVGTASGAAIASGAELFIGGIAGRQSGSFVAYNYFANEEVPSISDENKCGAVGSNGTAAAVTNQGFDAEGILDTTVSVNGTECSTALQALNAYVEAWPKTDNGVVRLTWVAGENGPVLQR